ncbi:hypothetical protein BRO54_2992 [Geobacillus proteiniphilus]|uniref:Uncharacterized protein n=1 Tax=Geobacillus proteiniphilus TaxID=860353 RepID=A0A1Q5SRZ7_9BACL|nr:hypothetical protein BRO54_2992 [Geobacillus proteiniphilus]
MFVCLSYKQSVFTCKTTTMLVEVLQGGWAYDPPHSRYYRFLLHNALHSDACYDDFLFPQLLSDFKIQLSQH